MVYLWCKKNIDKQDFVIQANTVMSSIVLINCSIIILNQLWEGNSYEKNT